MTTLFECETETPLQDENAALLQRVAQLEQIVASYKWEMEQLRQSASLFRTVADFTYDWEYWLGPDQSYCYVSPSCERITGYSPTAFLQNPGLLKTIIHPDDKPLFQQHLDMFDSREPYLIRFRIITSTGEVRWIGHACQMVYGTDGRWLGRRVSNRDITEQVRAEAEICLSNAQLQAVFDNAAVGIVLTDANGRFTQFNDRWLAMIGYSPDECTHLSFESIMRYDDRASIQQAFEHLRAGELPNLRIEKRFVCKDGSLFWGDLSVTTVGKGQGQAEAFVAIVVDVTEHKQTEEALQTSRNQLQAILGSVADAIYVLDTSQRIIYANDAAAQVLGYASVDELLQTMHSTPRFEIVHASDQPIPFDYGLGQLSQQGGQVPPTILHLREISSGKERWVVVQSTPIVDSDGGIRMSVVVTHDITEQKQLETALRRANELLSQWVVTVEQHSYNLNLLNKMSSFLQSCQSFDEAYPTIAYFAQYFFPGYSGGLYLLTPTGQLELVTVWGNHPPEATPMEMQGMQCLQQSSVQPVGIMSDHPYFKHPIENSSEKYIGVYPCIPLLVQDRLLGVLRICEFDYQSVPKTDYFSRVAHMVAGQLALELSNLALRVQLRNQAIRDPLTGLFNRRYLDETLRRELQRAERQRDPVGVIMLDIDHFKRFNDSYGHDSGDVLLQAVGSLLQNISRRGDIACRYGGEEFLLVLPGMSLEDTCRRAEQIRVDVSRLSLVHHGQPLRTVTLSLGVAIFPEHGDTDDVLIRAADSALYRAKRNGRDQVIVAEPSQYQL